MDAQKHIFAQDGEKLRRRENASKTLVNNLESKLHAQSLRSSTQSSHFFEAVEADLQRLLYNAQNGVLESRNEFRSESAFLDGF